MLKRINYFLLATVILGSTILAGCSVDLIKKYDVVIIGSGISGLATAVELSEAGKKVLIIEETGVLGGNKLFNAEGISFVNQQAGDTEASFKEDILANNNGDSNYYVNNLATAGSKIPSWLEKQGINFTNVIQLPGNTTPRTYITNKSVHTGMEIITQLEKRLKKLGADIHYESEITKISMDDKKIYSISIEQKTTVLTINASTIVFAEDSKRAFDSATVIKNKDQLLNFASETKIDTTDGMNLYKILNADYRTSGDMNLIDTYNTTSGNVVTPIIRSYGGILINTEGKRFVNELANSYEISEAMLNQPDQKNYLIFDDTIAKKMPFLADSFTSDTIKKSGSLVELSQIIKVDENNLRDTISGYQQQIINKSEDAFGKTLTISDDTFGSFGMNEGTLYAIEVNPAVTIVSTYAEVTNKFEAMSNGNIIPGIYAIGDSAYDIRLHSMLYGTELTLQVAMGIESASYILTYLEKN